MKSFKDLAKAGMVAAAALTATVSAVAADPIKIGVITPLSGVYADIGPQTQNAIKLFMQKHGSQVAGREIVVLYKDETGPAPEISKRLVQELIVRDKVAFIAGIAFTPNALAVAPLVTQGKIPTIVTNASSAGLTSRSPYIVRTSFTQPQVTAPLAKWAANNRIKTAYTLVADFSPGLEAEQSFKTGFTAGGGTIIGETRVPLANPEFAPYVQRVKDAKPDAVFVFEPAPAGIAFMKAFVERQLAGSGIKVLSTGDLVEEDSLSALGDAAVGVITAHQYSSWHDSAMNKSFVADFEKQFNRRPNFYAVAAYDGMRIIYDTIAKLGGNIDGEKAIEAIKGMRFESPRGPIKIDAKTRDIVQTVYVRRTEKVNGGLRNTEIQSYPAVDDTDK